MSNISPLLAGSTVNQLTQPSTRLLQAADRTKAAAGAQRVVDAGAVERAEEVREAFTSFVGETFYTHMLKAARKTVGKPAYFHGGQGEEVFRSQLDQQMAQELTASTGDRFAEPMFERQFPAEAQILRQAELANQAERAESNHAEGLDNLRRF